MLSRKRQVFILILYICSVYVLLNGPASSRFFEYSSRLLDARPCGCHTCLTESDPWFMKRFNKTLKPFLTKENNISEEIFDWWRRLQGGRYTFTDYREAVDKLFEILPDNEYITEPSPDRCRTCAVVGNSGNLKGSHYGPLIDSHDLIIRMNRGRTKGYEADVGTRTTHHVMYPESAKNVANTTRTVIFPFKTKDFFWLVSAFTTDPYQNVKARIKVSKEMIMVVSPVFMKYVHQIWLENPARTYPSTGFLTLILSMHMCDEVSVFGFGADSDGNWGHYFELLRNKKFGTGLHKGPHEYRIIQHISNLHVIQMYKGW